MDISAALSDQGTILTALQHDHGLVRSVRIRWRAIGGAWNEVMGSTSAVPSQRVEFYAEAIGPGGALLARAGSEAEPIRPALEPAAVARESVVEPDPSLVEPPEPRGPGLAIGLSIAAVAVVAALIIAIVLTRPTDTEITPQVEWGP